MIKKPNVIPPGAAYWWYEESENAWYARMKNGAMYRSRNGVNWVSKGL